MVNMPVKEVVMSSRKDEPREVTHTVARRFEGPEGRVLQVGEAVDARDPHVWANREKLVRTGYLQPLLYVERRG
jgi:hypothetical protein